MEELPLRMARRRPSPTARFRTPDFSLASEQIPNLRALRPHG
jgi:hypothetical protein